MSDGHLLLWTLTISSARIAQPIEHRVGITKVDSLNLSTGSIFSVSLFFTEWK